MAVVTIVGVLAVLAIAAYRRYSAHAKTAEVPTMFMNIKIAQETYKDETFRYASPSKTIDEYYPNNTLPGTQKMNFAGDESGLGKGWKELAVETNGPVLFVYACTAGENGPPTPLGKGITVTNWPSNIDGQWYVVKAKADIYGSGVDTVFASGSFTGDLFSAND
ncbi:MAG TPA: hypothetical protein VFK05_34525 [Polyangiaceae bacterium]|nr:hypothetical protein [Polyangiaceae bacterium]